MNLKAVHSLPSFFLFIQILFCCITQTNALALIGIDFGTKFIKVGIVKPGKNFEIVLNEASKRKTENIVAFNTLPSGGEDALGSLERLFSKDASGMLSKKPSLAFNHLKTFLDNKNVQVFGSLYTVKREEETGELSIDLHLPDDTTIELRIEEFFAMIFDYVKKISVNFASEGEPVKADIFDCVITVPSHFDSFKRLQMKSAATIAGLNVLSLINENSGAAINYAVYKNFDDFVNLVDGEKPQENILFFNIGHTYTQLSVAQYTARNNTKQGIVTKAKQASVIPEVTILSHASIKGLGGSMFDEIVANKLQSDFLLEYPDLGAAIEEDSRIKGRLLVKSSKVKVILSANEEIPVSIESFVKGKDLRTKLSRSVFELTSEIDEAIDDAVSELLKKANISKKDINAVELLGGAVRMPRLKSAIEAQFKEENIEVGQHLNGDEAMALGAVFLAANISKTFRVKKIDFTEISETGFNVEMEDLNEDTEWSKETSLFLPNTNLRSKKALGFTHGKDIIVQVSDTEDRVVGSYSVNIEKVVESSGKLYRTLEEKEKDELQIPKLSLTFQLTSDSLAELIKVEATFTAEREVKKKIKKPKVEKNETKEENDNTSEAEPEETEETVEATEEPEYEIEIKSKKHKVPVSFTMLFENLEMPVMNVDDIKNAKQTLRRFESIEDERQKLAYELNSLEGLIFSARDRIRSQENLDQVFDESLLESFFEELEALEDWLYEDEAKSATISDFKEKKKEINSKVALFIGKYTEFVTREDFITRTNKVITQAKASINRFQEQRPWVPQSKVDKYESAIADFETYFYDLVEKQKTLDPKEEPVLVSSEVIEELGKVQFLFESIIKIKKPLPKPDPTNITGNETEAAESTENSTGEGDSERETEEHNEVEEESKDEL